MSEFEVRAAADVAPERLAAFLRRHYGEHKAEFLIRHGAWWHRGDKHRWVLVTGDEIVGCCGVMPIRCQAGGTDFAASWKVDLLIAPEFRRRGLQRLLDHQVRRRGELLLGFPNLHSARVHEREGWRVRDDFATRLMPLDPSRMHSIRRARGARGALLRVAAWALSPFAALWRRRLTRRLDRSSSTNVQLCKDPDYGELAKVAREHLPARLVTTLRDESFLRWRYGEAPYPCLVYQAGGPRPRLVLIVRRTPAGAERWLDLFGDLEDQDLLTDLVAFAAGQAVRAGMSQVTVLAANTELNRSLRRCGFLFATRVRFFCHHEDRAIMDRISETPHHWGLGDSDADEP